MQDTIYYQCLLRMSAYDGTWANKLEQEKRQEGDAELKSFLAQAGLEEKYHDLFVEKKMTLSQLMEIDDAALKEIGLTLMGPRRKLTSAIARRKAADQLSATTN